MTPRTRAANAKQRRSTPPLRRGVLMIDLAITLTLIGIVLLAVIPTVRPEEHVKLVAASAIVASDVEFAQSATLASPSDPTVIRLDPEGGRYWLALASKPDEPIDRPGSPDPYEVEFGKGVAQNLWGLEMTLTNVEEATIGFNAFGRLMQDDDPVIVLSNEAGAVAVRIRATTGSVWIENPDG